MRDAIQYPNTLPGAVGRFRPEQIADRSTWNRIPDAQTILSGMVLIAVRPVGGSTVVTLNPTDPGTVDGGDGNDATEWGPGWLERPGGYGYLARHAQGGAR